MNDLRKQTQLKILHADNFRELRKHQGKPEKFIAFVGDFAQEDIQMFIEDYGLYLQLGPQHKKHSEDKNKS